MRPLSAIGAAFLIAFALPATSRADTPPAVAAAAQPSAPGCHCPGLRHARRPHRPAHYARYWRHWRPARVAMAPRAPIPADYDMPLPSPYDSAYDRAMTVHFRSPAVAGIYIADPGYPLTPPVVGLYPYRYQSGPTVFQYDGITGQYIALSQYDARRALPVAPAPVPR
jgi:hypothetical protein